MKEFLYIKGKKIRKICLRYLGDIILLGAALLMCFPILLLLTGVVKSTGELKDGLAPILGIGEGRIHWNLLPLYPTGEHLMDILLFKPQFHVVFWNSMKITACILAGQLFLAAPMAWGFARFSFPGKKVIFTLYVILMLMPFQVMMLPSYLILNAMDILDTHMAVILPAMCSTLPVFLMYQGFASIPKECIEAAQIDGADNWQVFMHLGLPLGSGGILSAMVLGYLEYWNMLEQPMTFLKTTAKFPLSLFLPQISMEQAGMVLAASLIMLVPAMFVFFAGQDYLEQGIAVSGLKG
ncbi:MAG: carbohydrate ABC transporter permease [Lachnospiraceae bacterium]|nr:carbohydrate ABC transporter permease [Lachnospiraceae bacterium]MDE6982248.1 carbohydrate ABC transporter permease [Lachnospiraceae bacterium]